MYISRLLSDKSSWPKVEDNPLITELNKKPMESVWLSFFKTESPSLTCLFRINQMKIEMGLKVLIKMLQDLPPGESIPEAIGKYW